MKKIKLILITSILIVFGQNLSAQLFEIVIDNGRIFVDGYNNCVFVPNDTTHQIVNLVVENTHDKVRLSSYYSKDSLQHVYYFFTGNSLHDSLTINFISKGTCPIGFLSLRTFDESWNLIESYSLFDSVLKINSKSVRYFQLSAFNAKSKLFYIDERIQKNNLVIFYDYLNPRHINKYEFIDTIIPTYER